MSDRSLKSVTYFSFDQLSEEEQEEQEERGLGLSTRLFPDFQLPQIGGKVARTCRARLEQTQRRTQKTKEARVTVGLGFFSPCSLTPTICCVRARYRSESVRLGPHDDRVPLLPSVSASVPCDPAALALQERESQTQSPAFITGTSTRPVTFNPRHFHLIVSMKDTQTTAQILQSHVTH
ncbi:unnamed protein product [Leuciscus chuanchicus]